MRSLVRTRLAVVLVAALLACATGGLTAPARASAAASVGIDAARGYAGYCADGGVTVDVSVWSPAHVEAQRCAPDVSAADSTFEVLHDAGLVVDGSALLHAAPSDPAWSFWSYTPTPGRPAPGVWTSRTAASLADPHPAAPLLRWWYGGAQASHYPPTPLPSTATFAVEVSDRDPAPGAAVQVWVTGTLWLEQVTVRFGGRVVSPAGYQSGIDNMTPALTIHAPAQSGRFAVTALGAGSGRAGSASLEVGGTPPPVVANPDPALVSVWQPCQPGAGVTEIVDFGALGAGDVEVRCAPLLPGEAMGELTGAAALTRAGFGLEGTGQFGDGVLCRARDKDGVARPTVAQTSCYRMPGTQAYWSYWHAEANRPWIYAGTGVADTAAPVEGWSFSTGSGKTIAPRLPAQDATGSHPVITDPQPNPSSAAALAAARTFLLAHLPAEPADGPSTPAPVTNSAYWSFALAAAEDGRDTHGLAQYAGRWSDPARWPTPTDVLHRADAYAGINALQYLLLARYSGAELAQPRADDLLAAIDQLFDPASGAFTLHGLGSFSHGATYLQAQLIDGLARLGADVPTAAVSWLLALQNADGSFDERPHVRAGQGGDLWDTALAVDALVALQRSGDTDARLAPAIDDAGAFLAAAQESDGGFAHTDAMDGVGIGTAADSSRVATTAILARALAGAGHAAAAGRAARWLTQSQLTAAEAAGGSGKSVVGAVADGIDGLGSLATDGSSALASSGATYATPLVALALAAAPYADPVAAQVVSGSAVDVTSTAASVAVVVRTGSHAQSVRVTYAAVGGASRVSAAQSLSGSTHPRGKTLRFALDGLQPATSYTARVTLTDSDGAVVTGGPIAFVTTGAITAPPGIADTVHFLTGRLVDDTHYESLPGSDDLGLTIDGALALAAAGAAGERDGDPALSRMLGYVRAHGTPWTGVGTQYLIGGAVAKEALLAEVVGANPRSFGGKDLVSALARSVCRRATTDGACLGAGNLRYTSAVFGQALGVLAAARAQAPDAAAIAYLEATQQRGGGFPAVLPSAPGTPGDVDSTAIAAMALDLVPGSVATTAVSRALSWLAGQQRSDGGFPGATGHSSNSTALAVQALSLAGDAHARVIAKARAFLRGLRNGDGGYAVAAPGGSSDLRATAQVLPGVIGVSYGTLRYAATVTATPPSAPSTGLGVTSSPSAPLAATGLDVAGLIRLALLALVVGALALGAGRRRASIRIREAARHRRVLA